MRRASWARHPATTLPYRPASTNASAPGRSATRRSIPGARASAGRGMMGTSAIGGGKAELAGGRGGLYLGLPVLLQCSREERPLQRCQGAGAPEQTMHVLVSVPADERD